MVCQPFLSARASHLPVFVIRPLCLPVCPPVYLSHSTAYPIQPWVLHPPKGLFFSKPDCSTTKRVPIPNDASSESSRRDLSNTDLCGADTIIISLLWRDRAWKIGQGNAPSYVLVAEIRRSRVGKKFDANRRAAWEC